MRSPNQSDAPRPAPVTLDRMFPSVSLTPDQFEEEVEKFLRRSGMGLSEFRVQRLETIEGSDGSYEIDVTARFEALGAQFLVLVECKQHRNPIKREVVQVLSDRIRALGAHKGMLFATTQFQKGAIEYATAHRIALVQISDSTAVYQTRSRTPPPVRPSIPAYAGWLRTLGADGAERFIGIKEGDPSELLAALADSTT